MTLYLDRALSLIGLSELPWSELGLSDQIQGELLRSVYCTCVGSLEFYFTFAGADALVHRIGVESGGSLSTWLQGSTGKLYLKKFKKSRLSRGCDFEDVYVSVFSDFSGETFNRFSQIDEALRLVLPAADVDATWCRISSRAIGREDVGALAESLALMVERRNSIAHYSDFRLGAARLPINSSTVARTRKLVEATLIETDRALVEAWSWA